MTPETHPAVSDAMREAVARVVDEHYPQHICRHNTEMALRAQRENEDTEEKVAEICALFASEIARLTERMESAEQYVTILIGEKREVEAERDAAIKDRDKLDLLVASYRSPPRLYTLCDMQASLDRADAAEADLTRMRAETERLRAALEPFVAEARRIYAVETAVEIGDRVQIWQSGPTEITRSRITYGDLRRARTALYNPEKTDGR